VPRDIINTLNYANREKDSFDFIIFHQANNFINSHVAKKLKLDINKIPSTIEKYGNTSSVSVPLTIVSELKNKMAGDKSLMLSAFGVGMTWATAIVPFVDLNISDIVEV
jgi:3-oxoacyl-[acyl-carrier-protein] synthase-3